MPPILGCEVADRWTVGRRLLAIVETLRAEKIAAADLISHPTESVLSGTYADADDSLIFRVITEQLMSQIMSAIEQTATKNRDQIEDNLFLGELE
jgi:hypothetical protein